MATRHSGMGLAWKMPERKKRRLPPPAATVLMSSCGAWIVTPAVVLSKTCSYRPAYRDTSGGACGRVMQWQEGAGKDRYGECSTGGRRRGFQSHTGHAA